MNAFVFPSDSLRTLRRALLQQKPKEAAALLLTGRAAAGAGMRLLVRESIPAPPEAYLLQEEARLELAPAFLAPPLKRARVDGWSLIFAHTHPLGG